MEQKLFTFQLDCGFARPRTRVNDLKSRLNLSEADEESSQGRDIPGPRQFATSYEPLEVNIQTGDDLASVLGPNATSNFVSKT